MVLTFKKGMSPNELQAPCIVVATEQGLFTAPVTIANNSATLFS